MQKRDSKGRFLPHGEKAKPRLKFKERYAKLSELDDAFLDGYERGVEMGRYKGKDALRAWKDKRN